VIICLWLWKIRACAIPWRARASFGDWLGKTVLWLLAGAEIVDGADAD
jgi:hypothetical protein